jgi:hypothetical protein
MVGVDCLQYDDFSTRLRISAECNSIESALRATDIVIQKSTATFHNFEHSICTSKSTVVHFSGHGTHEGLLMMGEDAQGYGRIIPSTTLGQNVA